VQSLLCSSNKLVTKDLTDDDNFNYKLIMIFNVVYCPKYCKNDEKN